MRGLTVLVLDQPTRSRAGLITRLEAEGFSVTVAEHPQAAAELESGNFACVIAERGAGGAELARSWSERPDAPPILLLDAFATRSERDGPLPPGVLEVLPRPLPDTSVLAAVQRALEHARLRRKEAELLAVDDAGASFGALTSRDPAMQRIFRLLETVADSRATVLIRGESGTGKTELARALHARSNRAEEAFVAVNCGALPESLLASELFGHAKGAFTGAATERIGKFEAADRGTLFLDEIGTATMDLQIKLLRVLEEGRFERVGETATREADVRIIAATNEDLDAAVAAKTFRMDLFYRLDVVSVEVPALRDRPDDVLLLAERFRRRFLARHGRGSAAFDARALRRLAVHDWPGNVRELQNTVERAVLLAEEEWLTPGDLWPGDDPRESTETPPWTLAQDANLRTAVEATERWWILRALNENRGSRQDTARRLGINRTTLFNKMRKYDLLSFPSDGSPSDDLDRAG